MGHRRERFCFWQGAGYFLRHCTRADSKVLWDFNMHVYYLFHVDVSSQGRAPTRPCSIGSPSVSCRTLFSQPIHPTSFHWDFYPCIDPLTYSTAHQFLQSLTYPLPPLWSSGQSSWLQIPRSGFDSLHYQILLKSSGFGTGSTQPSE
jgi:hypothetical protein